MNLKEMFAGVVIFAGAAVVAIFIMCIIIPMAVDMVNGEVHKDTTYAPHYVTFHLVPEEKGIGVAAWASDELPPTTGVTDENSDVTLELLSTVKYNIWIPQRNISLYVIPTQSRYNITGENKCEEMVKG